ncbi:MAG: hypothetical protein NZ455_06735 [Bacteroidia bacterium]|nr:hypothetical protein [Bacteroidia bacterium]MDW8346043.1 hypothetical protein [Bacteroidia bacterium]
MRRVRQQCIAPKRSAARSTPTCGHERSETPTRTRPKILKNRLLNKSYPTQE